MVACQVGVSRKPRLSTRRQASVKRWIKLNKADSHMKQKIQSAVGGSNILMRGCSNGLHKDAEELVLKDAEAHPYAKSSDEGEWCECPLHVFRRFSCKTGDCWNPEKSSRSIEFRVAGTLEVDYFF